MQCDICIYPLHDSPENVFQKNLLTFAGAASGTRRQERALRRGPVATRASAKTQVAPCPEDCDRRRDSHRRWFRDARVPFAPVAIATFLGILINTSAYSELNVELGFGVNVFWSIYNIAVLLLAVAVCVEPPQRRQHARLPASEPAVIRGQGQPDSACTIVEISLGGAKIAGPPPGWARTGEGGFLLLQGGALQIPLQIPFRFVRLDQRQSLGHRFAIVFEAGIPLRRALTARLFTGAYCSAIDDVDVPQVLFAVGKRLLR
jgi:PilZ domain